MNHPGMFTLRFIITSMATLWLVLSAAPAITLAETRALETAAQHVAAAFLSGDSQKVAAQLPRSGRVRVDLPALAPDAGSFLSPSQFRYLVDDIARRHRILSFELEPLPPFTENGAPVDGRLMVSLEAEGSSVTLVVRMIFVRMEGDWKLREFREKAPPSP